MTKNEILKILESAKDKNGDVPMRLVRQAFEKLPIEDAVSRQELLNEYYRLRENWNNADNAVDKCISVLKDLSSAQPETDCELKEFGNCSYSETGCSDCKVKAKIRNALSTQAEPCEDNKHCSNCMYSGRPTYKSPCSECRDNSQWEMKPISWSHENGTECEDTISRQAAIEALDKHLRMTDVPVSYPGIISALTEWLNELPSAQPESNWIPVSDRIPKDGENCLVSVRRSNYFLVDRGTYSTDLFKVDKEDFFGNRGESGWYYLSSEYGYCKILNVIAWMPEPRPYKEIKMKDLIERQAAIDAVYTANGTGTVLKALKQLPSAQPENIRCYECKHGIHSGCGNIYICNVSPELVMEHTGDFYCGYAKRKTDGEVD